MMMIFIPSTIPNDVFLFVVVVVVVVMIDKFVIPISKCSSPSFIMNRHTHFCWLQTLQNGSVGGFSGGNDVEKLRQLDMQNTNWSTINKLCAFLFTICLLLSSVHVGNTFTWITAAKNRWTEWETVINCINSTVTAITPKW